MRPWSNGGPVRRCCDSSHLVSNAVEGCHGYDRPSRIPAIRSKGPHPTTHRSRGRVGRHVHTSLPEGLLLGHGHVVVPDRGRVERGRQRPIDLGHVRAHAGQDQEQRHRRRRQRPLPPVQGGRRADAVDRRERLPVLHLLAAHLPARHGHAEPEGPRLLQPAGGRAGRGGHRAVPHALPLGSAAGAAGQGRVAEPGHGQGVRGLRRLRGREAQRPRAALLHDQRVPLVRGHGPSRPRWSMFRAGR